MCAVTSAASRTSFPVRTQAGEMSIVRLLAKYVLAAGFVAAIGAVSWILRTYGPGIPPMLLFVSILVTARTVGLGPSLLATLLSTLALNYFFNDPPFTLAASAEEFCDLAAFSIAAVITSALVSDLEEANVRLTKLQANLENHVTARTAELSQTNEQLRNEIDARREAEKSLARSNAELERFAYAISHEFQHPLRTIATNVSEIRQHLQSASIDDCARLLSDIDATTKRMASFASGLLSYSLAGDQRMKILDEVSMEGALQWAIANLRPTIDECGATITREALPSVRGDQAQLAHVFQNLLSNAIKYRSEKAPVVNVSAAESGGELVFAVRDNGAGIPEESRDKIFQMFTRLHGGSAYPGNGIGLAMCRRIIQGHGGRIWVESAVGRGSTFFFSLPQI
jgi:signal transduction histidine kinase